MINKIALILRKTFPNVYQKILNIKQGRYTYSFSEEKYPHSFLVHDAPHLNVKENAPEVIYCFWTGDNPLTENRKKALAILEKNAGIPVKLITPENLSDYILPEYPLHKGYELLSFVHRSDYLRCYFMHHHGGGYADVKVFNYSWKPAFKKLNQNQNKYVLGYPELLYGGLAPLKHRFLADKSIYKEYENQLISEQLVFDDLTKHTPLLIGNGSFICKPNTRFTNEWYEELHKRMDIAFEKLEEYYLRVNGNIIYSEEEYPEKGYPIPYFHLLGQIIHPLILKHHKRVIQYKKLLPVLKDYR